MTEALCDRWRPGVRLLPVSDDRVETHVAIEDPATGEPAAVHFQEWWVRHRAEPKANAIVPVGAEEDAPLGDFIEDAESADAENAVISGFLQDDLRRVLGTLEEREQAVIRMRYGLDDGQPRTLDQIGKAFGLSRERVRQIEREVMAKLRQGDRADRLRAYAS